MEAEFEERSRKEISQDIINLKPEDMPWANFYYEVKDFPRSSMNADKFCSDGEVMSVILLANMNPPVFPTRKGLEQAIKYGHLNVIKYLASLNPPILPDLQAVNLAAQYGRSDILQFLASLGISPSKASLEWVSKRMSSFAKTEEDLLQAIRHGDLKEIKDLVALGIVPTRKAIETAVSNKQEGILKYLVSLGIIPTSMDAYIAVEYENLAILKYLVSLGIFPTEDAIDRAIFRGNLDILKYLVSLGYQPSSFGMELARKSKYPEILDYLGIY